jgi:phosphate transport system substrate-binding protein
MNRFIRVVMILFGVLVCRGAVISPPLSSASPYKLVITGTGSGIGVMKLMAQAYQQKHPDVEVIVLPSIGSSGGIKATREGKIDIGLSSRALKPEERGPDLVEEGYGRTAFLFGAQAANPEKGFTIREIEEIYAGTRTTWHDGKQLRLVLRPRADAYSVYLESLSPGMRTATEKAHSIPGVFVGGTDQDAAAQIERTEGAFGVTSACLVKAEKKQIKGLSVDGVAPTLVNVTSGAYPYTMTMSVVYRKDTANPAVKQFIDFIFSPQGRKILTQTEHVAVNRYSSR